MKYTITQQYSTNNIKQKIFKGLREHSVAQLGVDHMGDEMSFEIYDENNEFVGALVGIPFWGSFWIKLLFIEEAHRGVGLASTVMEQALDYARELNLKFAFLETLSFQALDFYQKLGFTLDFTRDGYSDGVKFHYLRKDLS